MVEELTLGDSLARQGKHREAEACYSRAIEREPDALLARVRRAHIRVFELDDAAGALEDLLFVRDHADRESDAIAARNLEHLLGETHFRLQRYQEAIEHFEDALMLGDDPVLWAEQHLRLAECWEALADPAAMISALEAFLDLAPKARAKAEDVAWARAELARLRAPEGT